MSMFIDVDVLHRGIKYSRGDNAQAILEKPMSRARRDVKRLYTAQVFYYKIHSK